MLAAMALRGQELADFPEDLEGFPKNAARRAGHDSDDYVATTPLARSVAEVLGLPTEWFTAADPLEAVASEPESGSVARIEEKLDDALEQLDGLKAGQTAILVEVLDRLSELVERTERAADRLEADG